MIAELRVRGLATVSDAAVQLGPGLNVLSGETGAGKSLLVDAVALLLGERADTGAIRPGTAKAVVEGVVEGIDRTVAARIESMGLDIEEGRLVIRREIAPDRSRAWINGSPTTVKMLAEAGAWLVDLHGQHETQSLLHGDSQRAILDAYAGAEGMSAAVADAYYALSAVDQDARALEERRDEIRRRADYLHHVVAEIDAARVAPGEDDRLDQDAALLSEADNREAYARAIAAALDEDRDNALKALAKATRSLGQLERIDPAVTAWRELVDTAYANLTELSRTAGHYADGVDRSPGLLDQVERRRDVLGRLKQKYGGTLAAVLAAARQARDELDLLDTADLDLKGLAARRVAAEAALEAAAAALTEARTTAADRMARAVNRLLPKLGLSGGTLRVALDPLPALGPHGRETVAFLVQLNKGLEARPIAKVASGGELSRLMLALKVVLVQHDRVATLVFDEVDQGIGGEIGAQVAQALATVAGGRQVLVVTHLPQIAARADRHLVVSKGLHEGVATSEVRVIHGEDRILEVARMLGDSESAVARRHAGEMIEKAGRTVKPQRA